MSGGYDGRYDGRPGLVWYSGVTPTVGADLRVGDWLDSLDHRGARMIFGISMRDLTDETRTVTFFGGDSETVHKGVTYDVVDPDSQVAPDGSPLGPPAEPFVFPTSWGAAGSRGVPRPSGEGLSVQVGSEEAHPQGAGAQSGEAGQRALLPQVKHWWARIRGGGAR